MAEDDVTVAPDAPVEGGVEGSISDQTDTGGDTSDGSWPAEAQAEYTRKTQALADERRQWEAERTQQTQQLQQQATQGQQSHNTMIDQLRQMPYLDGATAAQLMERLVNEGINPLNQAIQQRDQAYSQLYKDYKSLRDIVGASQGKQAQSELDARFVQIREQQGLPDNEIVRELMQDVYLSHEGQNLDQEFPDLLRKRWEGLQKAVRESDRKSVQQARTSPFPSKGGELSPTSGKTGGYKTHEERTDELWPMMNPGQSE